MKKLIELKNKLSLTFKDYNTIRKEVCPQWPSEHFFRQAIEKLDTSVSIGMLYRNRYGCYVDSKKKIIHFIKENFENLNIKENVIRIKLVGDGTQTGPLTMLNFGFTLPDQSLISKTAPGNYQLGIFEIKTENYETLKICLAEILKDLSTMAKKDNTIKINGEIYKLNFH